MSERVPRAGSHDRAYFPATTHVESQPSRVESSSDRARQALGTLGLRMRCVESALEAVREARAANVPELRTRLDAAVVHAEKAAGVAHERADCLEPDARERLARAVAHLAHVREVASSTSVPQTASNNAPASLRDAVLQPAPRSLIERTPGLIAHGLSATAETGTIGAHAADRTDARLRAILESGEPEEVLERQIAELAAFLDDRERRALVARLKMYRPGTGDDLAARVTRLGSGSRQRILDTLGGASMLALGGPLHVPAGPVAITPAKEPDLGEAIESVRAVAEAAYQQLVDLDSRRVAKAAREEATRKSGDPVQISAEDGRDGIVLTATSALETRMLYVRSVYEQQAMEPKAVRELIVAASAPIQRIRAWIALRQDNVRLLAAYDRSLLEFDQLRQHVGLGPLSREPTELLAQVSIESADKERREVEQGARELEGAVVSAFTGFKLGAGRFLKFSELSRPPEELSAWKQLAAGILTSMFGNLMGPIVGTILKSHSKLTEATMDYLAGSTIDSVQAMTGTLVDNTLQKAENNNAMVRDAHLFHDGLVLAQARCIEAVAHAVNVRLMTKSISAVQLEQMKRDVQKTDPEKVAETTFQRAAHGFALLTAQRSLKVGANNRSDMDGFFGTEQAAMLGDGPGERRVVGSKQGRTGVGKLHVEVFDHGTGRVAGTQITKFEIQGMNDDMAAAVLANSGFQLDKLGVPLEVHITPPWFGRHKATPVIAIDETGSMRGSTDWEAFDPEHFSATSNGGTDRYPQARNAGFYSTPEKLWASIHRDSIPKTAVTVR